MPSITIPFKRRDYQKPLTDAILSGKYKRAFALYHRRAGKDLCLWNLIIRMATQKKGMYFYFLPTFTQAKKIIWDGITNDGIRFIHFVPEQIIQKRNESEMKLELKNGSIIQLIGTDNYDAIRGTNPRGCVFSEYAFQNPQAWEVVKPILRVNKGWAVFNTTPNGKNHAYNLFKLAESDDEWFCEKLTVEDTKVLSSEDIQRERLEGMSEDMIQQEYYCSFDIGALGAYYTKQIQEANEQNRITNVPREANVPVDLWLDLGRSDSTAIIFTQDIGREIHVIDHYEGSGESVEHYARILDEKGYRYGYMYLPHDATHKRLEANKTVQQQFMAAGFKTKIVQKVSIQNGIQEVRKIFPRCWFDKNKCKDLVNALENYHREWDDKNKVFRINPKHDWSSHSSDAMRYMAIGHRDKTNYVSREEVVKSRERWRNPAASGVRPRRSRQR